MPTFHKPYAQAIADEMVFPGQITMRVLMPSAVSGGALVIMEDTVEPGMGPPRHIHHKQDETFLVEEGRFAFEIDGQRIEAGPGDVALVPKGAVHAFRNIGDTAGRLRYIFSPALEIETLFRAFHEATVDGSADRDVMQQSGPTYGLEIAGPPLEG